MVVRLFTHNFGLREPLPPINIEERIRKMKILLIYALLHVVGIYNGIAITKFVIMWWQGDKNPNRMEIGRQGGLRQWHTKLSAHHYAVKQHPSGMQRYYSTYLALPVLLLVCHYAYHNH